jgi:hypothetical protein
VFAVIDTASKTGTENDATAVTFFAKDSSGRFPLLILDWDITQIEGAMLETWLSAEPARLTIFVSVRFAHSKSLHAYWMIVTRTRAFGIIVILAQSEFNLVGSPLYGVALKRHTVSELSA